MFMNVEYYARTCLLVLSRYLNYHYQIPYFFLNSNVKRFDERVVLIIQVCLNNKVYFYNSTVLYVSVAGGGECNKYTQRYIL